MLSAAEIWKPIEGYDNVEVSSFGRVRTSARGERSARIRRLSVNQHGYARVGLTSQGKGKLFYVQRLVCAAFHGPRPPGYDAAHLNGRRDDNRQENLQWKTRAANERDKLAHGTAGLGEQNSQAKLTAADVRLIRGSTRSESFLASQFGVSASHINNIKCRRKWAHIS